MLKQENREQEIRGKEDMALVVYKKEIPHEGVLSYALKERKERNKRTEDGLHLDFKRAFYEMCVFE